MLSRIIELYVAHGVPPSIPELVGNGRSLVHEIFTAVGSDGSTAWGDVLLSELMAASASARALNSEQPISTATFLDNSTTSKSMAKQQTC